MLWLSFINHLDGLHQSVQIKAFECNFHFCCGFLVMRLSSYIYPCSFGLFFFNVYGETAFSFIGSFMPSLYKDSYF